MADTRPTENAARPGQMVDSRWAEDVATGLLMRPNRSKQLSRSGCVLRRAWVCHLTLLTYLSVKLKKNLTSLFPSNLTA